MVYLCYFLVGSYLGDKGHHRGNTTLFFNCVAVPHCVSQIICYSFTCHHTTPYEQGLGNSGKEEPLYNRKTLRTEPGSVRGFCKLASW